MPPSSPAPPFLRLLCLSVNSDLLEVRISGHGADRCDQDDEIYLMVQEIWSGSEILGVKLFSERGATEDFVTVESGHKTLYKGSLAISRFFNR